MSRKGGTERPPASFIRSSSHAQLLVLVLHHDAVAEFGVVGDVDLVVGEEEAAVADHVVGDDRRSRGWRSSRRSRRRSRGSSVIPAGTLRSWCSTTAQPSLPSRTRPANSELRMSSGTKGSETRKRFQSSQPLPLPTRASISWGRGSGRRRDPVPAPPGAARRGSCIRFPRGQVGLRDEAEAVRSSSIILISFIGKGRIAPRGAIRAARNAVTERLLGGRGY